MVKKGYDGVQKMAKKLLLILMLISVLTYTGCGGGGGGGTIDPPTLVGAIQGTVSIGTTSSLSISTSTLNLAQSANFSKTSVRQSRFATESVANEKIVKLRSGLSATEAANIIASIGGTIKKKLYGTESTYLISLNDQTFSKSAASQNSNVEYVEDNLKFHAFATPNDPYFTAPYYWNYNMLNLPAAWDVKKETSSIIVAVLDTGISKTHPDLAANLVTGYDYVGELSDDDPSDTEYSNEDNRYSHGTHVAGIISAVTNNGVGISGVAWNVKVMPIRVLNSNGGGTSDDLIEGIDYAIKHGAKVINLSLGSSASPTETETLPVRNAIDTAIAAGVTVVAAAGNENGSVAFPANYDPVIAVSALDETGARASYSNYGSEIDFCAPGGGEAITIPSIQMILSTSYDKNPIEAGNCYVWMSGTSMAAPHISGLVALLYADGETDPATIKQRIADRCINLGNSSYYGKGLPDAYAVLNKSNPVMTNVKVFIGNLDGAIISNLQHVGASGSYNLSGLNAGTYNVCAFEDTNGNNVVDTGEKFAYKQVTVTANTIIIGVNITL